jgi:hypothetical protein
MKTYKSKIGFGIVSLLTIILGGTAVNMIINQEWFGLLVISLVAGFISYVFLTTYYQINGRELVIKSGFIINTTINIDQINKIEETNNPLSAPAASFDRIAIHFNDTDTILISPKEKSDFIAHLTQLNPQINVVLKKDRRN